MRAGKIIASYMYVNRLEAQKSDGASGKGCVSWWRASFYSWDSLRKIHSLHGLRNNSFGIALRSFQVFWWTAQMCAFWKRVLVVSSHSHESSVYCLAWFLRRPYQRLLFFTCLKKNISGLLDLQVHAPFNKQNKLPCTSVFLLQRWT